MCILNIRILIYVDSLFRECVCWKSSVNTSFFLVNLFWSGTVSMNSKFIAFLHSAWIWQWFKMVASKIFPYFIWSKQTIVLQWTLNPSPFFCLVVGLADADYLNVYLAASLKPVHWSSIYLSLSLKATMKSESSFPQVKFISYFYGYQATGKKVVFSSATAYKTPKTVTTLLKNT